MPLPDRTWWAPPLARWWAHTIALVMTGGAVSVFLGALETAHAGVLADLALGGFAFAAQYSALFARRARITLTEDAVVVVNTLAAPHTIALAEITSVAESPHGLTLSRRSGRPVCAGAIRTPRSAVRAERPGPATRIAEEIHAALAARTDRTSTETAHR